MSKSWLRDETRRIANITPEDAAARREQIRRETAETEQKELNKRYSSSMDRAETAAGLILLGTGSSSESGDNEVRKRYAAVIREEYKDVIAALKQVQYYFNGPHGCAADMRYAREKAEDMVEKVLLAENRSKL